MTRSPCVRCGIILHTGEGRVTVSFTIEELVGLAWAAYGIGDQDRIVDRLLCAVGLLDEAKERSTHAEMTKATKDEQGDGTVYCTLEGFGCHGDQHAAGCAIMVRR